jgi:hypothetical protein
MAKDIFYPGDTVELGGSPPRKPNRFDKLPCLEKFAVSGGFATSLLIVLLGLLGFYMQWQSLLDHGCGPGVLGSYIFKIFSQFSLVVVLALLYGYSNLRIYLPRS